MFATLSFFIELAMNLPSVFRSFDIERSDSRSSLTLHICMASQWLSPLRVVHAKVVHVREFQRQF